MRKEGAGEKHYILGMAGKAKHLFNMIELLGTTVPQGGSREYWRKKAENMANDRLNYFSLDLSERRN